MDHRQQEPGVYGLRSPGFTELHPLCIDSPGSSPDGASSEQLDREEGPSTILQVGSECFLVSRQRLAGMSPYFRALFFGGGRESMERRIQIRGVGVEEFRTLMEFAETSRLVLDQQNVTSILEAANFLQLEQARLRCCKFLERELHLSNCLGMMAYSWQLGCLELYQAARWVALTHLPALACEEDFLYLPKENVADLLSSDDLFLPREDLALEVILRWVAHDPGRREQDFLKLAGLVRAECLSLTYVGELLSSVRGSDPRARLICKLDADPPPSWTMLRSRQPRTRTHETLYALGGRHDREKQSLSQFYPRSGMWQPCAPFQRRNLTQYAVAVVGNAVAVTGGYFRDEVVWYSVDWVLMYMCGETRWVEAPPLQKSRHSHCAVGVGGELFVLGGSMDTGPIVDVERLGAGAERWRSASPLIRAVERAAVASLGFKIYVACGLDENGDVYSGIQRFDVELDQWDVISYSPFPRYDLCATVLNGALYLVGGQALRLDVETDEWTLLEEGCLVGKFFLGCTAVNGQIYLLAERRGNQALPNMLLLDPYTDTCMEIEDALPCPLPIRGCVSIRTASDSRVMTHKGWRMT
ncbi:kelch-like protein 5 [Huso huso]|uniref:Kelch-like protein 5 n=1 Tax=Huso huso TaxID=61971 RepID=A0ABR0Y412_HUSHU